jgi:hypothetical protein
VALATPDWRLRRTVIFSLFLNLTKNTSKTFLIEMLVKLNNLSLLSADKAFSRDKVQGKAKVPFTPPSVCRRTLNP